MMESRRIPTVNSSPSSAARGIGPTVLDRGQHRLEQLRVAAGEPGYSAHGVSVTAYEVVVVVGMVVTVAPAGTANSEAGGEVE